MARRDPGNKPASRIGIAWITVAIIIVVILGIFVVRVARPTSQMSTPALSKVPPSAQ